MVSSAAFWDKHAEGYSKQAVRNQADYDRKLELTRGFLRPDMTVMEFGCGTGSTAIAHAPFVKHIHGYDVSGKMVEIAREKAKAAGLENATFERASFEEMTAPDGAYDAVLALNILHLLKERREALAKIRRMLKPEGLLVSSTPCIVERLWYMMPILPIMQAIGRAPHVGIFSIRKLREEITGAGFEIEKEWIANKGNVLFAVARRTSN